LLATRLIAFVEVKRLAETGPSNGTRMRVDADGSPDMPAVRAAERAVMRRGGTLRPEAASP